ncbi:TPA: hypothetical protein PTV74_001387 [Clostridium botulinum]|uniref:hypothetical protein n=1 Tax=Clostridium botulinum TaxID=1491 RepID=UPI000D0DF473|nr:hypothetical protein [Clostridium botulinum]PSM00376.1 hypothetical protein C6C12_11600 [Clostridium botulinum]HDK7138925.1 hypothetical protein [Clostridium botulinum]HDK7142254.1 hypothetical protein [Clostridium botulinum]HDK7144148.1 hypothetical protein [Clostridium botulinum]HDK7147800.1 hypothetical protein [Clostridium botulinum]
MSDSVLVGIITALSSIITGIVVQYFQYKKDKLFKENDIMRKNLNSLYLLKEEIHTNDRIIKNALNYLEVSKEDRVNFYEVNQVPVNDIWNYVKKENILCIVDDKELIRPLFELYMCVGQCIIQHNHENDKIGKGTTNKETLEGIIKNIEFILKGIDTKIDKLYKKLK